MRWTTAASSAFDSFIYGRESLLLDRARSASAVSAAKSLSGRGVSGGGRGGRGREKHRRATQRHGRDKPRGQVGGEGDRSLGGRGNDLVRGAGWRRAGQLQPAVTLT